MASKIEWTEETWNPVVGCHERSMGCRNCYAARIAATRLKDHPDYDLTAMVGVDGKAHWTGHVRERPVELTRPAQWRRARRVFVCSMGDIFHKGVSYDFINLVLGVCRETTRHRYLLLTKRPERAEVALRSAAACGLWPLANVALGVSAEDGLNASVRVPVLARTPAAMRFVSAEPLLSGLSVEEHDPEHRIALVIAGGETGPGARPPHPGWFAGLRDECAATGRNFFFKAWGDYLPDYEADPSDWGLGEVPMSYLLGDLRGHEACVTEDDVLMRREHRVANRRLLDNVEHNDFPEGW